MMTKDHKIGTTVFIVFIVAIIFVWLWIPAKGVDDKSIYNLYGHSTPDWSDTTTAWWTFWDEHIDWQTTGKDWYYTHRTRNQVIGSYELAHNITGSDLTWMFAYFDSGSVHRDSGLAHFKVNTYYHPQALTDGEKRLVPGWDKANDVGGNWERDWDADYDYNNATTYFTVQRTSAPYYIQDAGGGQAGITWTTNKWQNAYVKLGWGGNADTFATTIDSSHVDTLYLNTQPPDSTYLWYIVDNPSAVNHNAVAMRDTCARIKSVVNWNYQFLNCRHWKTREFMSRLFHDRVLDRPAQPSNIYPDDVLKTANPWSCGSGWCDDIDMGGSCQESLDVDAVWRPAQRTYLHQIKDSLGTDGFLLANNYEPHDGWDTILYGGSVDGIWHEVWINGNGYVSHFNLYYNTIRKYMQSPYSYNLHFMHAPGGTTNGDTNRHKINCYAQYLFYYADSVYFLYNCSPSYGTQLGDTTNWWFGLMGRNLGTPSDTATSFTVEDSIIWKRPFTNGIAVWKPRPSTGSNYTDSTTGISLGAYYYELTIDGDSTGDSVNTITLLNAESFIGIKPSGETPPAGTHILFRK